MHCNNLPNVLIKFAYIFSFNDANSELHSSLGTASFDSIYDDSSENNLTTIPTTTYSGICAKKQGHGRHRRQGEWHGVDNLDLAQPLCERMCDFYKG